MCKKLISFVCLVLTFALVSPGYGDPPDANNLLVIGDWENQMDGWSLHAATTAYSTIGVTLNEFSLKTTTPSGWQRSITYRFEADDTVSPDEFFGHQYFCVDITRIASEWTRGEGDHWSSLKLIINTDVEGSTGWYDLGDDNTWWDSLDGDMTIEAVWDYSTQRDEFKGLIDGGASYTYLMFFLGTNTGGYDSIGSYYLDNAVLSGVPEPMTIALLGLGGLALLRRKRACNICKGLW